MTSSKSLMKSRNNSGPSTLSWGTPDWTGAEVGVAHSNKTCCCLFSRKSLIQLFMWPRIP
jgi:hypothetical protein